MWIPSALAQTSIIPAGGVPGCNFASGDLAASCVPMFIAHVIRVVFGFTGGVCLLLILLSGYRIILDLGERTNSKTMLQWAIIGFITSALTFFIIDFVISTLAGI